MTPKLLEIILPQSRKLPFSKVGAFAGTEQGIFSFPVYYGIFKNGNICIDG